jgi:hypothetical protein
MFRLWAIAATLAALFTAAVAEVPFFWDTVQLASKHAHFFYHNQLRWQPLPAAFDSGHPPLLGYYLACGWTFWGKTLPVSHWLMWPFLTIFWALLAQIGHFLSKNTLSGWWLVAIVALDPTVAGQSSLVSPDLLLISGCTMCIWGVLGQHKAWLLAGTLLLSLVSMRGMMTAAGIGLWWLWWQYRTQPQFQWWPTLLRSWPFWPGVLLAGGFLYWHWQATGWIGHHPQSEWAGAFERTDAKGLLRNAAIVAWRWLDQQRWLCWGIACLLSWRFRLWRSPWAVLTLLMALCLSPTALLYHNLSAHRYFMPLFLALHLWVFEALTVWSRQRHTTAQGSATNWWSAFTRPVTVLTALVLNMAAANFIIYPRGISMDWDCSLAHLAYHPLRAEAMHWFDTQGIDYARIGSAFPNLNTGAHLLLNSDQRHCAPFDTARNQWVLISNVFNDIDEPEYAQLANGWRLVRRSGHAGVWVEVWKKEGM